jgi:hypothetical protein
MFRRLGLGALLAASVGALLIAPIDVDGEGPIFRIAVPIPPQPPAPAIAPFDPIVPVSPAPPRKPVKTASVAPGSWRAYLLPIQDDSGDSLVNSNSWLCSVRGAD